VTLSHHRHAMLLGPCMLIHHKITTMYRSITLRSYIAAIWCKIYAPLACRTSLDTEPRVHARILTRVVCACMSAEAIACNTQVAGEVSARTRDVART